MNKISAKRFLDSVSVISYKLTELENTDNGYTEIYFLLI